MAEIQRRKSPTAKIPTTIYLTPEVSNKLEQIRRRRLREGVARRAAGYSAIVGEAILAMAGKTGGVRECRRT